MAVGSSAPLLVGAVMMKDETFHNVGDSAYVTTYNPMLHVDKITSREGFIALIVTDRIVNTCAQAGVLPRHGQLPGINHLWSVLYRHIDLVIRGLNAKIASGDRIEQILRCVVDLLSIDVSTNPPISRQPAPLVAFSFFFWQFIFFLSPPLFYTDKQKTLLAFRHGSCVESPC